MGSMTDPKYHIEPSEPPAHGPASRRPRNLADQAKLAPFDDRFELRVHAELAAEAADVGADGRVADSKPQGDAAARQPFRHQPQHLLLARGQAPELGIVRLALGDQRPHGPRRDHYPAPSYSP